MNPASRRAVILGLGALAASGCAGADPVVTVPPALPPLATTPLPSLLAAAGFRWALWLRPRELFAPAFLRAALFEAFPEANLARFRAATGVDVTTLEEAVVAGYGDGDEASVLWLARHPEPPDPIDRLLGARIQPARERVYDRPDLFRVAGEPPSADVYARLGPDVFAYQVGGDRDRGPARVASLYATGRLVRAPRALALPELDALVRRFGTPPALGVARGPFTGDAERLARGLLLDASAVGLAVRPSAREHLAVALAVGGDFRGRGAESSEKLLAAFDDVSRSDLGQRLGLGALRETPLATFADDAVALALEFDAGRLGRGFREVANASWFEIFGLAR